MRARIRVHLIGHNLHLQPVELHDQVLKNLEYRYDEHGYITSIFYSYWFKLVVYHLLYKPNILLKILGPYRRASYDSISLAAN
jgi:hypothetical protein